jgi:elongation factor P
VEEVRLERRVYQLLYHADGEYMVMDPRSYEQISLPVSLVGDAAKYLTDNSEVEILFVGDTPIVVESPSFVNLAITETDPGLRGDTASGGTKPAVLETGLVVQVPLFVKEGETIRIDTRNDTYLERVNTKG